MSTKTVDITQYIQQRRGMGIPDFQIRQELLANGWQPAMLDQVFQQLSAPAFAAAAQPFAAAQPVVIPKRRFNKKLVIVLVVLLIGVGGAVAFWPRAKHKAADTADTLGHPALQQNQSNVSRKNDVLSLIAKIDEYQANNSGVLPAVIRVIDSHTVRLCDAQCNATAATDASLTFDVSGVEIRPYTAALRVPNDQALYVVPSAACSADQTSVTNSASRSFAVLYQITSGGRAQQACASN